jgi:hypothetical protein
MVYPAQSPDTLPASMPSCWFIFAGMWLFDYNYVSADSWDGYAEKNNKKDYLLTWPGSIEIVPEISLPPCTVYVMDGILKMMQKSPNSNLESVLSEKSTKH